MEVTSATNLPPVIAKVCIVKVTAFDNSMAAFFLEEESFSATCV